MSRLANYCFKVSFYLKAILYDAKNVSKYRDVAPLMFSVMIRSIRTNNSQINTNFMLIDNIVELGVSRNRVGSLYRANEQYSPPRNPPNWAVSPCFIH